MHISECIPRSRISTLEGLQCSALVDTVKQFSKIIVYKQHIVCIIRKKLKQIRKKKPIKQGGNSVYFLAKAHDCITSVVCFRSGSTITEFGKAADPLRDELSLN